MKLCIIIFVILLYLTVLSATMYKIFNVIFNCSDIGDYH